MSTPANLTDHNSTKYSALLKRCEHAYNEIKEGHEKEVRENFPVEYHLLKKYLYRDLPDLMQQLERRLAF